MSKLVIRSVIENMHRKNGMDAIQEQILPHFEGSETTEFLGRSLIQTIDAGIDIKRRYNSLKLLNSVQESVIKGEPFQHQILMVLKRIVDVFPIRRAWVLEYNREDECLEFFGGYVTQDASTDFPQRVSKPQNLEQRPVWHSLFYNHPSNVKDIHDPSHLANPISVYNSFRVKSFLVVPLWDSYGEVGVLIMDNKNNEDGYESVEEWMETDETLQAFLGILANVVENRRMPRELIDRVVNKTVVISNFAKTIEKNSHLTQSEKEKLAKIRGEVEQINNLLHKYMYMKGMTRYDDNMGSINLKDFFFHIMYKLDEANYENVTLVLDEPTQNILVCANPECLSNSIAMAVRKGFDRMGNSVKNMNAHMELCEDSVNLNFVFEGAVISEHVLSMMNSTVKKTENENRAISQMLCFFNNSGAENVKLVQTSQGIEFQISYLRQ
ncbi:hypothetical protein KO465_01015 [Candidatus Micrarchaeota archaeon]|nr:hypothetical protein [Candidatus Micrarchaeota archaeon]